MRSQNTLLITQLDLCNNYQKIIPITLNYSLKLLIVSEKYVLSPEKESSL